MVKRGRMRTLLRVEERASTDSGFGDGSLDTWDLVREERFSLTGQGGQEYQQGEQMRSDITHIGRCRWFDGADSGMRLKSGGRVFHVARVFNEDERNRWLVWELKETNA